MGVVKHGDLLLKKNFFSENDNLADVLSNRKINLFVYKFCFSFQTLQFFQNLFAVFVFNR